MGGSGANLDARAGKKKNVKPATRKAYERAAAAADKKVAAAELAVASTPSVENQQVLEQARAAASTELGGGAVIAKASATGAAVGTPEPMRGVDDAGVRLASARDDEDFDAILVSQEALAQYAEAEKQAAHAPPARWRRLLII